MKQPNFLAIFGLACTVLASGCGVKLHGQPLPTRVIAPNDGDFAERPGEVILHYYGAGGWGILWRGHYIVAAPYFSNHSLVRLAADSVQPKPHEIEAGLRGTPFRRISALLIGHGHIDHAGDVPLLMQTQPVDHPPALIADRSTVHLLAKVLDKFSCVDPILYDESDKPRRRCPIGGPQPVVRVTAVHSDHAPHTQIQGIGLAAFVGNHDRPLNRLPTHAKDFVLGQTWAYVLDLLDESQNVVFRIHYVDAAPSAPQGILDLPVAASREVDVHIGCVPGHDMVEDYPRALLAANRVQYVIGAHWEDFFQSRSDDLKPLQFVLDQANMNAYVDKVEAALGKAAGPVAPLPDARWQVPQTCGPSGPRWNVPVPGQTLRFAVGK